MTSIMTIDTNTIAPTPLNPPISETSDSISKGLIDQLSKIYDMNKRGSVIRMAEMLGTTSQVVVEWFQLSNSKRKNQHFQRVPSRKFIPRILEMIETKPELVCKRTGPPLGTRWKKKVAEKLSGDAN